MMAVTVWALMAVVIGIPVLLIGLVYPSRWVLSRSGLLWSRAMLAIAGMRLNVEGRDRLTGDGPRFYMANHQSALDIPIVLIVTGGDTLFFSKASLFRIPIFGGILRRYGIVPIHQVRKRETFAALERMLARLERNPMSVSVFPEGTRTRDGSLSPFRKGTMKIAVRAGFTVVPIAIDGSFKVNHRDEFRLRPGTVRVTLAEPIPGAEVAEMSSIQLHDRVVGAISHALGLTSPVGCP